MKNKSSITFITRVGVKSKLKKKKKILLLSKPMSYLTKIKLLKKKKIYSWDEWVPEDRVLKFTDTNVQKQKEVEKVLGQAGNKQKKSGGSLKVHSRRSEGNKDKEKESNSRASTPVALLERTPSRASKSGSTHTPTSSSESPLEAPRKKRG